MFCYSYTKNDFGEEMYCAIIIVRGGTMFVSHPHKRKCKHISIFIYSFTKRTFCRQNKVPTNEEVIGCPEAATYQHRNVTISFNV